MLTRKIGEKLDLGCKQLEILEAAGFSYEIGKIRIPKSILDKRGPLTDEERDILRHHLIPT